MHTYYIPIVDVADVYTIELTFEQQCGNKSETIAGQRSMSVALPNRNNFIGQSIVNTRSEYMH